MPSSVISALPHQRTNSRTGSPARLSSAGDRELRIPNLRAGPILPSLLERQHRQVHGYKGCGVTTLGAKG
jgi:hypothetical protein